MIPTSISCRSQSPRCFKDHALAVRFIDWRRDEIITACAKLYETKAFKDITIKEIGSETSFTRTSIYNYFRTKEEIFLALLQREYERWIDDLNGLMASHDTLTATQLAREVAASMAKRECLLKLMSMNHFDMEANSRDTLLIAFKYTYGESLCAMDRCLQRFRPRMIDSQRQTFLYAFFPFMYGIYPYTVVTEKQRKAMEDAKITFVYHTIDELVYRCVLELLGTAD